MPRSVKKGPYIDPKLLKKIQELNRTNTKKVIKTWARRSTISPEFVGHTKQKNQCGLNSWILVKFGEYSWKLLQ
ncbi:hypothetical protein B5M50_03330 [candidate division KSB1 bacterium 4484_219]|nr:MAG: hypothetical protein B5M50_03330 [candidate division KSB1 bacterium 4484_219]